tara:strand:- start:69 stop:326 length:258 start_codon:yes stop_codon:yes gene_type:complete
MQNKKKKFNAEGSGFDYESARKYGMKPDAYGKWESRVPETGLLLKGAKHHSWKKTLEGEKKMGCKVVKKGGRYYSICPDDSLKKK